MSEEWIKIVRLGNEWASETVYIHPVEETAKVFYSKCTYWGYHDESEYDEFEYSISVERALSMVYPDAKAIQTILRLTKGDYSDTLAELIKGDKK